ncbi:MAG: hypothetical protein QM820_04855 [Minicystis sp.]
MNGAAVDATGAPATRARSTPLSGWLVRSTASRLAGSGSARTSPRRRAARPARIRLSTIPTTSPKPMRITRPSASGSTPR